MKLTNSYSRPGTSGQFQGLADLKLGMNCINRTGVQQNTTCMFDTQFPEKPEPKEEIKEIDTRVPCVVHRGYRKPTLDQRNPYILRKLLMNY